jgi:hypothetical protein
MAMGVGTYMLYKHKTTAQRNLIMRATPTVQTVNPVSIQRESSFRTAFKPIGRSLSA